MSLTMYSNCQASVVKFIFKQGYKLLLINLKLGIQRFQYM